MVPTLALWLAGTVVLGGTATLGWALSLTKTADTSDRYLSLLSGVIWQPSGQQQDVVTPQPAEPVPDACIGRNGQALCTAASVQRAAAASTTARNATSPSALVDPTSPSAAFVDPGSSLVVVTAPARSRAEQLRQSVQSFVPQAQQAEPARRPQPAQQRSDAAAVARQPHAQPLPPPPPLLSPSPPPPPLVQSQQTPRPPRPLAAARGTHSASTESFAGEPVPLHKQTGGWLSRCTRSFKVGGDLGMSEYWRERRHFYYYKHLYCVVARYADGATTALDVGSALPPFINMFDWIRNRTILGPYFAGNVAKNGGGIHGEREFALHRIESKYGVRAIEADFALWSPPSELSLFDVVICSEVVEHIRSAAPFVQKLLTLGLVVVLSVPYKWEACDGCHHEHDDISLAQVARWAGRKPFAYDIVKENNADERLICVFRSADGAALQKPGRPGDAGDQSSGGAAAPDGEPGRVVVSEVTGNAYVRHGDRLEDAKAIKNLA